jgi:two-component system NtrC family sensor kinase
MTLIALAPLVITGVVNLSQFRSAYEAKVRDHLEAMIHNHADSIDRFKSDRLSDIRVVAREHPLAQMADPDFLRRILNLLREEYHGAFVDIGLVDESGVQIAYAGPFNLEGVDYSNAAWFRAASDREDFISDVFTGLRGTPHFIVAAQRMVDDSSYLVRATIDFEAFNALVENIRIGRTGFAFIFNLEGEFQTRPRFDVALNRSPYADVLEGRLEVRRITTIEGEDALGRPSIFTMAPLKGGQWFLCYQQTKADAFAELRQVELVAVTVFFLVALTTVLVSYLLSRQLAARLATVDRQRTIMSDKVIETGRLASIGELAAGIAHEINNPVAIMVEEAGWIEDLLTDNGLSSASDLAEVERAVKQIRTQGERCKAITYKLLSFARKTDPTVRDVALNEMVEEVLGLVHQKTRYANVTITTRLEPDLPPVSASPSELQQVLLNLVNNAIDAIGHEGGVVTVTTRSEDQRVVLEVNDTGQGIPEANLTRIFDPFFTTKPVGQGTGLGLSICYGIVDKLGGRIAVDSEVGRGTTFTVQLSAGRPGNGTGGASQTGDPREGNRR